MSNPPRHENRSNDYRTDSEEVPWLHNALQVLGRRERTHRRIIWVFTLCMTVPLVGWSIVRAAAWTNMQINCVSPLRQADAEKSDLKSALHHTNRALVYVESLGGVHQPCTSVIQSSECGDDNVKAWHDELVEFQKELQAAQDAADERKAARDLAKSPGNLVGEDKEAIEIAETTHAIRALKHAHQHGSWSNDHDNVPSGLSVYPFNTLLALWGWVAFALAVFAAVAHKTVGQPNSEEREILRRVNADAERIAARQSNTRVATPVAVPNVNGGGDALEDEGEKSGTRRAM